MKVWRFIGHQPHISTMNIIKHIARLLGEYTMTSIQVGNLPFFK